MSDAKLDMEKQGVIKLFTDGCIQITDMQTYKSIFLYKFANDQPVLTKKNKKIVNMEIVRLTNSIHTLYTTFENLYKNSFPIFEQRTVEQQEKAFASDKYHLDCYFKEGLFIGFISYWEFDDYIYIEHFAILRELRGSGYGSTLLKEFICRNSKQALLEIDPVTDEISAARLRFYKACGFYENSYLHTHPPYRNEFEGHSLVILTTNNEINEEKYFRFSSDLKNIVML